MAPFWVGGQRKAEFFFPPSGEARGFRWDFFFFFFPGSPTVQWPSFFFFGSFPGFSFFSASTGRVPTCSLLSNRPARLHSFFLSSPGVDGGVFLFSFFMSFQRAGPGRPFLRAGARLSRPPYFFFTHSGLAGWSGGSPFCFFSSSSPKPWRGFPLFFFFLFSGCMSFGLSP